MSESDIIDISVTAEEIKFLKELAEKPWVRCFGYLPRIVPDKEPMILKMGEFYVEHEGDGTFFQHLADDEPDIEYERFTIYKSHEGPSEKHLKSVENYIASDESQYRKFYQEKKKIYLGKTWDGFYERSTGDTIKHIMSDGALFVNNYGIFFIAMSGRTGLDVNIYKEKFDLNEQSLREIYKKDYDSFEELF